MERSPQSRRGTGAELDTAGALATAGEVGPFFGLDAWRAQEGWQPLDDLVTKPTLLAERVDIAREVIARQANVAGASVEPRVAASIVFLGVSARLLSSTLAATVLTGVVPELAVAALWWRPVPGGPWPMAAGPVSGRWVGDLSSAGQLRGAADSLTVTTVSGVVAPLLEAFGEAFRVSRLVLWGNVASGLAGAAGVLATARPDRAEPTAGLVDRMLNLPPLQGTGDLVRPDPSSAARFLVRRSCCLFYRVPGAGLCGDCVLTPEDVRRTQWQSARSKR